MTTTLTSRAPVLESASRTDAAALAASTRRPARPKPWCNYAVHRTTSDRRSAGGKIRKVKHHKSKRRANHLIQQWWQQR
ncbi:hypothetical protein [Phytohabitans kaempferiae]|uniref:Uncharacterized protein n=1 Tax=Phytohabitans kaempferiae TaxID=1620943 RepID=A0ABV6MBN1_9ACTN